MLRYLVTYPVRNFLQNRRHPSKSSLHAVDLPLDIYSEIVSCQPPVFECIRSVFTWACRIAYYRIIANLWSNLPITLLVRILLYNIKHTVVEYNVVHEDVQPFVKVMVYYTVNIHRAVQLHKYSHRSGRKGASCLAAKF